MRLGWLEKFAPTLWLLYIHKNQFYKLLSKSCENELLNIEIGMRYDWAEYAGGAGTAMDKQFGDG